MADMVKKWILFMCTLGTICILVVMCSSCTSSSRYKAQVKEYMQSIMENIKDKDIEAIYNEFSVYQREQYTGDLLKELEEMYNFIEGNIVSFEEYTDEGLEEAKDDGKVYLYKCYPMYEKVITDNQREYEIKIGYVLIDDEKPDNVGIAYIRIKDDTGNKFYIGKND